MKGTAKSLQLLLRSLLLALLWAISSVPALAADNATAGSPRLALVIANSAYREFDALSAAASDGDRIAGALTASGFRGNGGGAVIVNSDLTLAEMTAQVAAFRDRLRAAGPDAFGVLYYSGHGAALASFGDVALVPVDSDREPGADSLSLTRAYLVRMLLGSGAGNILVILDMCRNVLPMPADARPALWKNEDLAVGPASGSKGLRRVVREGNSPDRPDQGYLVAYSTSGDQVAFDNGTFSRILAEEIRRPRQNIADALKRTSDRVAISAIRDGRNFQKPTFDYGLQGAPPCFVSCNSGSDGRFYDCANCPYMRIVPAGAAPLGSPATEARRGDDEATRRQVSIARPFAMSVYEVSVSEWAACVRDGACRPAANWSKENPNPLMPAAGVSFAEATAFVGWLAAQTGLPYRLPTEIEWEYAARGGASSVFAWGDTISPANANYDHSASYAGSPTAPYRGYPEAINAYPPNDFGLYQMNGNVWEWTDGCADSGCKARVARGGSFDSSPDELRAANRFGITGGRKRDDVGVRVVRDLSPDEMGS